MRKRWILYLTVLLGCFVFYVAHGQWLSWLLLCLVAGLPILSLMLCLLELCFLQPSVQLPGQIAVGQSFPLSVHFPKSPLMTWQYRIEVTNTLTRDKYLLDAGDTFPADHCGLLQCRTKGMFLSDCLGLFRLRLLPGKIWKIPVRPIPVEMPLSEEVSLRLAQSWQPKHGGGFSERYDLRQYRPGDSLNQIHWKLSAKTGKYIIREAMIPSQGQILVTLYLRGTGPELNEKLGNLLWMGNYLLRLGTGFRIHALSGDGILQYAVSQASDLEEAVTELLAAAPAQAGSHLEPVSASWHCHIGGDEDEA